MEHRTVDDDPASCLTSRALQLELVPDRGHLARARFALRCWLSIICAYSVVCAPARHWSTSGLSAQILSSGPGCPLGHIRAAGVQLPLHGSPMSEF